MPYITKESLQAAKQMDLLTYLQLCDPQNLVHLSGDLLHPRARLAENQQRKMALVFPSYRWMLSP